MDFAASDGAALALRSVGHSPDNGFDTFMIEPDRDATRCDTDGDTVADDDGASMVNLEATPTGQFNRERTKRLSRRQPFDQGLEVIGSHVTIVTSPRRAASGNATMPYHVSKARFAELVERALAELPEPFAAHLDEVPVEVRQRPTRKQLQSVGLGEDDLLLGLYQGRPLTERSVMDSGNLPDVIYVFQEDVETVSDTEADLIEEVRKTVLHELGHHYGMDEDDLDELGYG
jgi:predicted Zn-dependent protease with MMP-like domain